MHEFPITLNGYIKLHLLSCCHRLYNTVHAADFNSKYCDDAFDTCFFYLIGYSRFLSVLVCVLVCLHGCTICSTAWTTAHWLSQYARKIELNTMNDRACNDTNVVNAQPNRNNDNMKQWATHRECTVKKDERRTRDRDMNWKTTRAAIAPASAAEHSAEEGGKKIVCKLSDSCRCSISWSFFNGSLFSVDFAQVQSLNNWITVSGNNTIRALSVVAKWYRRWQFQNWTKMDTKRQE